MVLECMTAFPPPAANDQVIMGGLAILPIACYGKLYLVLYSIEDVVLALTNVAHVPGLGLNLFSLHVVGKQQAVFIDPVGVHVTPGRSFSPVTLGASCLPRVRCTHIRSSPA